MEPRSFNLIVIGSAITYTASGREPKSFTYDTYDSTACLHTQWSARGCLLDPVLLIHFREAKLRQATYNSFDMFFRGVYFLGPSVEDIDPGDPRAETRSSYVLAPLRQDAWEDQCPA